MKKIVTLIFCTAVLSSAFAQRNDGNWNNRNNNSVVYNDNYKDHRYDNDRNDDRGYRDARYIQYQKQQQLQKVDEQYNYQLQQVMNNWSMNRRQKKHAIEDLRAQRAQQISSINYQYANNNAYNANRNNNDHGHDRYDSEHDGR